MTAVASDQARLDQLQHVQADRSAHLSSPAAAAPPPSALSPPEPAAAVVPTASPLSSLNATVSLHAELKRSYSSTTSDFPAPAQFFVQKRANYGSERVRGSGAGASPTDSECEGYEAEHGAAGVAAAATASGMNFAQDTGTVNKRASRFGMRRLCTSHSDFL